MTSSPEADLLRGLRVVNLSTNIPGPVAAARLRDFGAQVVKVEPPQGDALRGMCPSWYAALTESMEVVTLDLKSPAGRDVLDQHLETADLLLTASRPAALERLGLGWEKIHAQFPRLCMVSIVGHAPPHENRAGHDLTYQAKLGTLAPPHLPKVLLADMAGAERTVSAALALLLARERGHEATYQAISLEESAAAFSESLTRGITREGGILGGGLAAYNIYPARAGWVAVAALEAHFLARLQEALNLQEVSSDTLREFFLQRPAQEWEDWASAQDLPLAAIPKGMAESKSNKPRAGNLTRPRNETQRRGGQPRG